MAKVTKVALATKEGTLREFDIDTAERILRMKNSGWHLAKGSEFELKEDGTIGRRNKKENAGAA